MPCHIPYVPCVYGAVQQQGSLKCQANIALYGILLSSDRVRCLYANLAEHLLAVAHNDPTNTHVV